MTLTESHIDNAALAWFGDPPSHALWGTGFGYAFVHGPEIAPGELAAECDELSEELLRGRIRDVLLRVNQNLPSEALFDVKGRETN